MKLVALNQFSVIKQGDTKNEFRFKLLDYNDNAIDLTGKTVSISIANSIGKILDKDPTVEDAAAGIISFSFMDEDVTGFGDMRLEVYVTDVEGKKEIIPSDGYYKFVINRSLNDTSAGVTSYTLQYFTDQLDGKMTEVDTKIGEIERTLGTAAANAETKATELEQRVETAIAAGTQDLEVKDARGEFTNLGQRLAATDSQLAQTMNEAKRKRELEDLSPTVLAAIEGGEGTEFNLLSIPQDGSVTPKKTDFLEGKKNTLNLLNPKEFIPNGYYRVTDGKWIEGIANSTGLVPIEYGKTYITKQSGRHVTYWDVNETFISGVVTETQGFTIPNDPNIKYLRMSINDLTTYMLIKGNRYFNTFVPYVEDSYLMNIKIETNIKPDNVEYLSRKSVNLINPDEVISGGYFRYQDGVWTPFAGINSTGFIEATPGDTYSKKRGSQVTYWDADYNFVVGADEPEMNFTVPQNPSIKYMRISMYTELDTWMVVQGTSYPTEFVPYNKFTIPSENFEIEGLETQVKTLISNSTPNITTGVLRLPTYNNPYDFQNTHPSVYDFGVAWNGYRYWMGVTPFEGQNDALENPCILCSNNLVDWVEPAEGVNPLDSTANVGLYHFSDTHLVYNGTSLEIWYRERTRNTLGDSEKIWRRTSTDGTNWTPKEMLFESIGTFKKCLSPVVIIDEGKYKIWLIDDSSKNTTAKTTPMKYYESTDGTNWTHIRDISIPFGSGNGIWHMDIKKTSVGYEMYWCDYKLNIFYSVSDDNIAYNNQTRIFSGRFGSYDEYLYRPCFVDVGENRYLFYGCIDRNMRWYVALAKGKKSQPTIFERCELFY